MNDGGIIIIDINCDSAAVDSSRGYILAHARPNYIVLVITLGGLAQLTGHQ